MNDKKMFVKSKKIYVREIQSLSMVTNDSAIITVIKYIYFYHVL